MRDQGRLTSWDDDKGFGFVTPDNGGLRAFVHIRAFSYRHRRPRNGDIITYQLGWDPKGRPRAENVLFREIKLAPKSARASSQRSTPTTGGVSYTFCASFLLGVLILATVGKLPWTVLLVYAGVSLLLFCAYAFDKSAAQNRGWRTKESTLQMLALLGGWPGGVVAQRVFHHKSRKESFQLTFRAIVIVHVIGLVMVAANFPIESVLMKINQLFS